MTDSPVLALAKDLISRQSVTPEDAGCQDLMIERLKALGFEIEVMVFEDTTNFWARRGSEAPLFTFAGHTDVVPKEMYKELHINAELSNEEYITTKIIIRELEKFNVKYMRPLKTGVVAYVGGGVETILIRADIDALPIVEDNNLSYKSKNIGVMHSCGHDAHTAILLGIINYITSSNFVDNLRYKMIFIFQPAEETTGGAASIIQNSNIKSVDYSLCIHVNPKLLVGEFLVRRNIANATSTSIRLGIKGKNAHGAYPHLGHDAIIDASNILNNIQSMMSRKLNPTNFNVLTFGKIEGGNRENIICNNVDIYGTLRTIEDTNRSFIVDNLQKIIKSYNCENTLVTKNGYTSITNTDNMVEFLKQAISNTQLQGKLSITDIPSLGVDDFGEFSRISKKGSIYYYFGISNINTINNNAAHSANFLLDLECFKHILNTQLELIHIINAQ